MKLAVLLIHGIGDQRRDWAARIIARLQQALDRAVRELDPAAPAGAAAVAAFEAVHWAAILQQRQQFLHAQWAKAPLPQLSRPPFWRLVLRARRWYLQRFKAQERRFVAEFLGDVIGYPGPEAYPQVHAAVAEVLDRLAQACAGSEEKCPLTLIGHSLGAVIASDHVYDALKRRGASGFHARLALENFFTLGSPQALFSLKYGGPAAFKSPVRVETARGRWINVLDPIDPVALPLRALNDAYAQAVSVDLQLNTGRWLDAHVRYFDDAHVIGLIARKLALDWAAWNRRLRPADLRQAEAAFARQLMGLEGVK